MSFDRKREKLLPDFISILTNHSFFSYFWGILLKYGFISPYRIYEWCQKKKFASWWRNKFQLELVGTFDKTHFCENILLSQKSKYCVVTYHLYHSFGRGLLRFKVPLVKKIILKPSFFTLQINIQAIEISKKMSKGLEIFFPFIRM